MVRVSGLCMHGGSAHCIGEVTCSSACVGMGAKVSGVGMKATVHDLGLLCLTASSSLDSLEPCLDFFLGCVTCSRSTIRSAYTL